MRRATSWSARLAVAMLGLTPFGCGGGDNAADTPVANESAPPEPAPPAAEVAAEPAARGDSAAPAGRSALAEAEPAPAAPANAKGDASGTNELLNLANNATPAPAAEAPAGDAAAPAGGSGSGQPMLGSGPPGGQGMLGSGPPGQNTAAMSGSMRPPGYPGAPGSGAMPGYPGAPGAPGAPGYPGGSSGSSGSSGMMAGMPGGGGPTGPADFRTPIGAVQAFLAAVQTKDKDRIAEATALRSPQEASTERMKKLFSTIVDLSVSDETVADMAKQLQGFQISGTNDAKSSARLGVIVSKSNNRGGTLQRTITVRKEAKGWKVLDIGGVGEIEAMPGMTPGRGAAPRRR